MSWSRRREPRGSEAVFAPAARPTDEAVAAELEADGREAFAGCEEALEVYERTRRQLERRTKGGR